MRREALDALFRIYRASNELPELLQVAKQLHENSPHEAPLTCNYARLALLLAPNTEDAQHAAKEAYEAAPTDPACAVTYAFALYGIGRTTEGLEILKKLPNEQLHDSHAAVYVALLLLDNNERDAAREFIDAAQKGTLNVEERKLLDEAVAKLAAPPSVPSQTPAGAPLLDNATLSLPLPARSPTPHVKSSPIPAPSAIEPPGSTPVVHPLLRDGG